MYIPIILGTAREGRQSGKVARFVEGEAAKAGLETEVIDVRDYPASATDNRLQTDMAKKLAAKLSKADGLVVISPEYNHGYPGELKLLLDMLYKQYERKPIGIIGVSGGGLGGARVVEQLRLVVVELRMVPIRNALYFPGVQDLFDGQGRIRDASYHERAKAFFDELVWYAKALKVARESTDNSNK